MKNIKIIDTTVMNQVYEKDGWLYWKEHKNYNALKDSLVGTLSKRGYYSVMINGQFYYIHRILYQIYNNVILSPVDVIDHIDGNKQNNKKENLRLCTQSQNCMNKKASKNNKLGIKNICISHGKHYDYYQIYIKKNLKIVFGKCYRTDKYTLDDVIKIRDIELLKYHKEFINAGENNI